MDLDVRTRTVGSGTVLEAEGEIDLSTCGRLRDSLRTAQERGAEHVVIDLTEVDFIDSTGLSVLVDGAREARKAGTTLDVVAEGHLRELLRITGLDTVMPVHPALQAALGPDAEDAPAPHA